VSRPAVGGTRGAPRPEPSRRNGSTNSPPPTPARSFVTTPETAGWFVGCGNTMRPTASRVRRNENRAVLVYAVVGAESEKAVEVNASAPAVDEGRLTPRPRASSRRRPKNARARHGVSATARATAPSARTPRSATRKAGSRGDRCLFRTPRGQRRGTRGPHSASRTARRSEERQAGTCSVTAAASIIAASISRFGTFGEG
jgi:hypothetical protein